MLRTLGFPLEGKLSPKVTEEVLSSFLPPGKHKFPVETGLACSAKTELNFILNVKKTVQTMICTVFSCFV